MYIMKSLFNLHIIIHLFGEFCVFIFFSFLQLFPAHHPNTPVANNSEQATIALDSMTTVWFGMVTTKIPIKTHDTNQHWVVWLDTGLSTCYSLIKIWYKFNMHLRKVAPKSTYDNS